MSSRNYTANNSSRLIQGDGNEYIDASVDQSIKIGQSFNERGVQVESLTKFASALREASKAPGDAADAAAREVDKARDELKDENSPDGSRITKWLDRAKTILTGIDVGSKILEAGKQAYSLLGLGW